jgi:uncharacterized membrane protein
MELLADLHHSIVHFPVALFLLYFLFETSGIVFKREFLLKASYIILIAGVVAGLAAVLTGNRAKEAADLLLHNLPGLYADPIGRHEEFATYLVWYFSGVLVLRTYFLVKKKISGNVRYIFIILGIVGCILVYKTGSSGGELVYKYGIGTRLLGK